MRLRFVQEVDSCLQQRTIKAMENCSWNKLASEIEMHAPTLYSVLHPCV